MLREQTYIGCIKRVDSILVSANNENFVRIIFSQEELEEAYANLICLMPSSSGKTHPCHSAEP